MREVNGLRALTLGLALAMGTVGCSSGQTAAPADAESAPVDAGADLVPPPPPPTPSGCIDSVTAGDHVYTCDGLRVDASIPAAASPPAAV